MSRDATALATLIEKSVRNKADVVAEDEREAGARALLNFGHTFGHALETVTGYSEYLHGEAISIGMVVAAKLSESRDLCREGVSDRLSKLLIKLGLPVTLPGHLSLETFMETMALDKKVLSGQLRLVLLTDLGKAVIDSGSKADEIHSCLLEASDD